MILSISCYVLIKDPFTNSLSDEQIKRNRNKASSKLLALSSAYQLLLKENETMSTSENISKSNFHDNC